MRRGLWLAAGVLLLTTVAIPTARAASSDWDESWSAPPEAVYTADPTFTSTFLYKPCDQHLCNIDQISGLLTGGPTTQGCTLPSIGPVVYGNDDPTQWQTLRGVDDKPHFNCNGTYTLKRAAHAQSPHRVCSDVNPCDLGWSDDLTATFKVAIPPAAPAGVAASADSSGITVTWQPIATPDPDFEGYRVSRVDASGNRAAIADKVQTGTTYVDSTAPSGDFTYVVQALRDGPDTDLVVSEDAASPAVAFTAPTTTTASSSGSDGAGGDGVVHVTGSHSSNGSTTHATTQDPSVQSDDGFSTELPYEAEPGEVQARPSVVTHDPKPGAGLLVPTAVATVLVVWAMHILYITRQARWANAALVPIEVEPTSGGASPGGYDEYRVDDFDDWDDFLER